jgi:hypothetical protein
MGGQIVFVIFKISDFIFLMYFLHEMNKMNKMNAQCGDSVCWSACFISGTTEWIL